MKIGAEHRAQLCHSSWTSCCVTITVYQHNKMVTLGYLNTVDGEGKLPTCSSAVLIGLSPALGSLSFTSMCESSYTNWVRRCPVSCVSSTQNSVRRRRRIWKTKWGMRSLYCFSLTCTPGWLWVHCCPQYIKRAYPWPSIVPRHQCLASFAELR